MSTNYKEVDFSKAIDDMRKLLKDTHNIKRKPGITSYNYTGSQEIEHHSVTAVVNNIKESFTQNSLEYEQERGNDMLEVIISCIYRLGYSAAKIEVDKKTEEYKSKVDQMIESYAAKFPEKLK